MDVRLVVEKGSQRKHAFKMRGGEMILGRKTGCGIRIPSAAVSRQHCRLLAADGFLTAEDLDSVNGTFLNGEAVVGCRVVRPGDRLHVGPATFVVEYELTPEALQRLRPDSDYDYEIVEVDENGLEEADEEALPVADEFVLEDEAEPAGDGWQTIDDDDAPPGRDKR